MLPEFHKARASLVIAGLGLILRLLAVHAELWDTQWLMLTAKAIGIGIMFAGLSVATTYVIEGIVAMRRIHVEVKKAEEKKLT